MRIEGGERLERLALDLRAVGRGDLRKELNKELRGVANPIRDDLRSAIQSVNVKGVRGGGSKQRLAFESASGPKRAKARGLRASIARSVETKVTLSGRRTGVRIRVNPMKLPPDQRALPRLIDRGEWRHPVFGNREVWAAQKGSPWFYVTIRPHADLARKKVEAVMGEIRRRLEESI